MIFDFFYYCILLLVPEKAIFGKKQVACTLYSSFSSFIIFGILLWVSINLKIFLSNFVIGLAVTLIVGGLFVLTRHVYLNPDKQQILAERYHEKPLWLLKIIGIVYLLSCFIGYIILGIFTTKIASGL